MARTNGENVKELKAEVEKNPKRSLTQELKNEVKKIVKSMRDTAKTVFASGGVSAMISKGPSIAGGKQVEATRNRNESYRS